MGGFVAGPFLVGFELFDIPVFIEGDQIFRDAFLLLQVESDLVDFHQVIGEGGLCDKEVLHQFGPSLAERAVTGVGFPNVEYFF